jgi:hypothetical protein
MKIIAYLFFCTIIFSCKRSQHNLNFEKRIPIDGAGNFDLIYQYIKAQTKYAKLNIIENGFDSFYIRIWYASSTNMDQQVIDFYKKSDSDSWNGNYYYLALDTTNINLRYPKKLTEGIPDTDGYYYSLDTAQTMFRIVKNEKLKDPKNGWGVFGKELLNTKITTASDWSNRADYEIDHSISSLLIEIATKDYYRIFSYYSLSPDAKTKPTQKVIDLIKLVEDNLGIKLILKMR